MGYQTEYKGIFYFHKELSASQLAKLKSYFGEDYRDHPEWDIGNAHFYYIELEFNDDFSGIRWNGAEKTYDMPNIINFVICEMRKEYPDFALNGKMSCQGEDIDDRYDIVIENGLAKKVEIKPSGTKVTCPHCDESFYLE